MPTVFENYTASFEIEKHRIELNMWDTSGKTISRLCLCCVLEADVKSIVSQPCRGVCPWVWQGGTASNSLSNFFSSHLFDKLLWPSQLVMSFVFSRFLFVCLLFNSGHLLVLETLVPAMSLCVLCVHSFMSCPLCVAACSHDLAQGQATVGRRKGLWRG